MKRLDVAAFCLKTKHAFLVLQDVGFSKARRYMEQEIKKFL